MNLASVWQSAAAGRRREQRHRADDRRRDTIGGSIVARGAAFGLPTWHVRRRHPEMFAQVEDVVRTLDRWAPGFLVLDTRRLGPHSKGDDLRDDDEMAAFARAIR